MKRFLIKSVCVATQENPNFAGQVHVVYSGKGDKQLASLSSHAEATYSAFDARRYMTKEYGYTRKCDAARSYSYKHPENSKFWRTEVEIVEVEA